MSTFVSGFDWDTGNRAKCQKHGVSVDEIEDLFERPIMILPDTAHSTTEERLRAIGRTESGRKEPIRVLVMGCIGQTGASVRSGGAGDAVRIVKPSRRGNRACPADPEGRVFKTLGRRPAPLAMRNIAARHHPSPRP